MNLVCVKQVVSSYLKFTTHFPANPPNARTSKNKLRSYALE
jgi:hypothetical protein